MVENRYFPDYQLPPIEEIKEMLVEALGVTEEELIEHLKPREESLASLIENEKKITPEIAVQLERILDVPASFWKNKQKLYDECLDRNRKLKGLK